ncbi:MAG TPA: FCD domain-containing protein [Acidimicrobiales bacterium]|nr:FCD domain-containing protein [Acidimicrobiales bacterium]
MRPTTPNVHVPKVAELVAAHLRWRIVAGELADGDALPRESDLLAEFGVSRPSLREALRVLETEGLVRIRRGNVGGAVVRRPNTATAAYHLSLTLRANEVTHEDLAVARLSVEPICAALAAGLPDRQAIAGELTRLVDESERCTTTAAFTEAAHEFHRRLTELCGNTTMTLLAGTLEAVWGAQETRAVEFELRPDSSKERRSSIAAHRRLIAAISAGDADRASREMRGHLAEAQEVLIEEFGPTVIAPTTPPVASPVRDRADRSRSA